MGRQGQLGGARIFMEFRCPSVRKFRFFSQFPRTLAQRRTRSTEIPSHRLTWHYRSRHETLIAFSNHNYYDNELITFPAAETRASAVEWRRVQGVYAKGKGRNNQIEAKAIVEETVRRLTDPAFVASGKSIGIITLNGERQKLVSDLLDQARAEHPEIEPYFQLDQSEPVVV
ncbi:MAG: hypothetical protein WC617_20385 [Rhodanobacter sp.]|jgi:hypothetical protein